MSPEATDDRRPSAAAPRILFVVDALAHNGAIFLAVGMAARLRDAAIFALLPLESERRVPIDPAVTVIAGTSGRVRFRWAWPRAFARLVAACRRAEVVVAVSEVGPAVLVTSLAARIARRPFAVMIHADLDAAIEQWVPRRLRPATRLVHRRADAALCVSSAFVPAAVANGLDARRVHVVPPGVDTGRIQELAREPASLPPTEAPRVVGVGRLSHEKGFDLLVRAHAEVRSAGLEHELILVGEGPLREELGALAEGLGVGNSVRLLGLVPNPFPIVASATAFVLPSRREGLPLALLEALTLGVPVIATRCAPAVEAALGDGEVGDLVEPGSVDELTEALRRHLSRPERLRARAARAADSMRGYDVGESAAQLGEVARRLAERRPSVGAVSPAREATDD